MNTFLGNFLIEIALFTFLGMLYYFYQKRKILKYEAEKGPLIAGYLLQSCLTERGEKAHPQLDVIIEAIDDYLHNRSATLPIALLKNYAEGTECSSELRDVIFSSLEELKDGN
jgi:hypothetical protein